MTRRMKGKYFCGQNPRSADFYAGLLPTFHFCYYCVLFLNHSPYFLSANNEQWLTHAVGNYLLKKVKVNAGLIIVYLDSICPLNWTLVVVRQNVSVAGAISPCTDYPKADSHWVRPMVHPGLWRPSRTFCGPWDKGSQAALLKGIFHGMSWGKECTSGLVHWIQLEGHKMQSQDPQKGRKRESEESTLDILEVLRKSWAFWSKFRYLKRKEVLLLLFRIMRWGGGWVGLRVNKGEKGFYIIVFLYLCDS